jgi:hypothetical protein
MSIFLAAKRWLTVATILKALSTATQEARINRGTVSDYPTFKLHFFHSEKWLDPARAACLVFCFLFWSLSAAYLSTIMNLASGH